MRYVSIHAPWEGCDIHGLIYVAFVYLFQFTHPGKGATVQYNDNNHIYYVSIHAPWEGCDRERTTPSARHRVSIHAPWEGCDGQVYGALDDSLKFQFTHPGKGATRRGSLAHRRR